MIKAEFGIIDHIDCNRDYSVYEPEKFGCIAIDDDIYLDDWWSQLTSMKTYFHSLDRPSFALARYGITLIPPESLSTFQNIVISDKRIHNDENLVLLLEKIAQAIREKKYMIHYGI